MFLDVLCKSDTRCDGKERFIAFWRFDSISTWGQKIRRNLQTHLVCKLCFADLKIVNLKFILIDIRNRNFPRVTRAPIWFCFEKNQIAY